MSDSLEIGVKLLRDNARMPVRGTEHSSGMDLYACLADGPVELSQHPTVIQTGIATEVPVGLDVQIRPRSGLSKRGVLCTFGTLDADYRGELMVLMYTLAADICYSVEHGDRIAQMVVSRLVDVTLVERNELSETERGHGGHGSTGR